jgi:hypothetical protein
MFWNETCLCLSSFFILQIEKIFSILNVPKLFIVRYINKAVVILLVTFVITSYYSLSLALVELALYVRKNLI